MQRVIITLILLIIYSSCNYKLLVNKDRVYNTRTGYLMFFNRQKFFFPSKNIKGRDFITAKFKNAGYLVNFDKEEGVLYEIAEKYVIDYKYFYNGKDVFVRDTIKVLPVKIGSLPYKIKGKIGRTGDLTIKYNDTLKVLRYYSTNNEAVWSVYPIFEEDIKKAAHYYNR